MLTLNISNRLKLSFSLIILTVLGILVYLIVEVNKTDKLIYEVANDRIPKMIQVEQIANRNNYTARAFRNLLILTEPKEIEKEKKVILDNKDLVQKQIEDLIKKLRNPKAIEISNKLLEHQKSFISLVDQFLLHIEKGNRQEAYNVYQNIRPVFRELIKETEDLNAVQSNLSTA